MTFYFATNIACTGFAAILYPGNIDRGLYPGNMSRMSSASYVAFVGARSVAAGHLADVLPILQKRQLKKPSELLLLFEVETGRQVELNLQRSLAELLEREEGPKTNGPGRPRLGVVSREVSLLPRHWAWLEEQPNGISAALRRLVEQGIRTEPGKQRAQRQRAALSRILGAIAGDRPNFEEACRALYAGDMERFGGLVARWPHDIKAYATQHAADAARAERGTT